MSLDSSPGAPASGRAAKATRKRATASPVMPAEGRVRAVVDALLPQVDGGRYAVKRLQGESFEVRAHVFTDGHDLVRVRLCWRAEGSNAPFNETEMEPLGNDEWVARCTPKTVGSYRYTAAAWVDHFSSWRNALRRRVDARDIVLAACAGALLVEAAAARARGEDRKALSKWSRSLRRQADAASRAHGDADIEGLRTLAMDVSLAEVTARYPDRRLETRYCSALDAACADGLPLRVDRARAGFSAWYEMFPRSAALDEGQHGTFRDVQARLPYVAELGFNVLYLPPIHPIGRDQRKGRNNALAAEPGDVGSPWAIGAAEGGHKDVLPALGTLRDFAALVAKASALGIEIALDIAFQCAPDHPYVMQHPQWFSTRPDGSVQYAENPPKKYQDIYPFNFETEDWRALWLELKSVFDHWIALGVKIFRVDNPHTKAFPFWEWAIHAIKAEQPDVLFLAEAFTRPKVMHRLAKLGFSQSYTYFTWRNSRDELTAYFRELTSPPGVEYFRPNVWPNTPDILHEVLHDAPRSVFMSRVLLAATLCANYGIYGPAYELMERRPRSAGSEDYLDSEKYQLRSWNLERPDSLARFVAMLNRIRAENPALQSNRQLNFFDTDNPQLIAYAKRFGAPELEGGVSNAVLTVVNLDPHHRQSGWVHVDAYWLGLDPHQSYQVYDMLSGQTFTWRNGGNFVILDPADMPAHVLRVRRSSQQ